VDFINAGSRYFLPATSVGYPGGTGKNKNLLPSIAPWSSLIYSTTHWNGLVDLTVSVFDESGNSASSVGGFDIENTYVTKVFTTHICDPSRPDCPRVSWNATFSVTYPAIAKERIEWFNSNFSSNYAGSISGDVTNGYNTISSGVFPRYWTGNVFEYDFGGPVFRASSSNDIGASLGDIYLCLGKDCPITPGTAETDITVSITYPQ
ncbi:MAG TPA: hypothetical protein VE758_08065, partial [Chthoniobacterales bacterium]|nr:hypothetical protein [Chthoniobacterales bacterium]